MVGLTRVCAKSLDFGNTSDSLVNWDHDIVCFPPIQFLPGLKYRITEEDIIS